ncbi:hypothetical protein [Mesorhizobium sp. L-8-3]|nr:hypothetical protein [Mesorhizobium sp. L-8-3]BCH23278.1 hypothetical protein MesoLjLb_30630 [Mesorhizobium sp. L-8-3]
MPSDSLWVIVAVLAVFGFFTAAVVWADATWRPRRILPDEHLTSGQRR